MNVVKLEIFYSFLCVLVLLRQGLFKFPRQERFYYHTSTPAVSTMAYTPGVLLRQHQSACIPIYFYDDAIDHHTSNPLLKEWLTHLKGCDTLGVPLCQHQST